MKRFLLIALLALLPIQALAVTQPTVYKTFGKEVLTKDDLNNSFTQWTNYIINNFLGGGSTFTIADGDSMLVNGLGKFDSLRVTGRSWFPNGTAALPGISFFADPNTGAYRVSEDTLGVVAGGTFSIKINGGDVIVGDDLKLKTTGSIIDFFDGDVVLTHSANQLAVTGGILTGITGSKMGDLTLADGSITSAGAAISFGAENLTTTGTLASGAMTITGAGSFTGILSTSDTTEATTTTAASLKTAGGIAWFKDAYVGDDMFFTSGAVLDFGASNLTVTHSSGTLTIAGDVSATDLDGIIGSNTAAAGTFTDLTSTGNTIVGNATGDALTINPSAWTLANAVTITGTWADLSTVTTADINGGTLDGVTIGATVAPTVTNLGTVTTADINGGTIDGVTIGATSAPTVTDLGSVATADINGGSIDGTTVGSASASTGAFTTLSSTSTTGFPSLTTVGDLTLADGSITSSSVAISFGVENLSTSGTLASGVLTVTGAILPNADDGGALGASGTEFSDLFLNTGGVINFEAGDVVVTHSSNTLAVTGGILTGITGSKMGDLTLADGSITSDGAAISFGAENLSTTGTLASGALTVTGAATATTTFTAASDLAIGTGSVTSVTGAISFGDEALTTTGTLASGAMTVTGAASATGVLSTSDATDATSTTEASLKTAGGLGVVKDAVFGADLGVGAAPTLGRIHITDTTQGNAIAERGLVLTGPGSSASTVGNGINGGRYVNLADDAAVDIYTNRTVGVLFINIDRASDGDKVSFAIIAGRFINGAAESVTLVSQGGDGYTFAVTTLALTGTAGSDATFNVGGCDASKVQFENRTGETVHVSWTWMSN